MRELDVEMVQAIFEEIEKLKAAQPIAVEQDAKENHPISSKSRVVYRRVSSGWVTMEKMSHRAKGS